MRCFVAIELTADVRRQLAAVQEKLQPLGRAVKWVRPEQIHLTVKFLGEVADRDLPAVCDAVQSAASLVQPVELEVRGTGCFPPAGPARVIWAGITGPPSELLEFQQACEQALAKLGFQPEQRAYRPHLTIGRVRNARQSNPIRAALNQQDTFSGGRFLANELILFHSVLSPSGPTHTVLSRSPLGQHPVVP